MFYILWIIFLLVYNNYEFLQCLFFMMLTVSRYLFNDVSSLTSPDSSLSIFPIINKPSRTPREDTKEESL